MSTWRHYDSTIVQLNFGWQWNNRFDMEAPENVNVLPAKMLRCQQQTGFDSKNEHPLYLQRFQFLR